VWADCLACASGYDHDFEPIQFHFTINERRRVGKSSSLAYDGRTTLGAIKQQLAHCRLSLRERTLEKTPCRGAKGDIHCFVSLYSMQSRLGTLVSTFLDSLEPGMIRLSLLSCLACLLLSADGGFATADQLARSFYAADSSKGLLARVEDSGEISWRYKIGPLHDLHLLPNGNLLLQTSWTRIVELDPKDNRVVWEYDAKTNGNENRKVEVHAFQRLAGGLTMIAESGPGRIIEVDREGKIQKEFPLKIEKPHVHHDTRLVRKLDDGHFLVCHENDGAVREYDATGRVVWDYQVPLFGKSRQDGHGPEAFGNQCFAAVRLKNGNTLISTGNGHGVIEVTPEKKIVWSVHQDDLPGIKLAWVTTLQVLKNSHIVLGNCHAGADHPQLIEITKDKKVVWSFNNFKDFGNSLTNSIIIEEGERGTSAR
jgi:outer membrane protein assembly factor BamB